MPLPRVPVTRPCQLPKQAFGGDNLAMPKDSPREETESMRHGYGRGPFSPGSMVVVTLCNPREKFWGMILALAQEGLGMCGIELASFEDLAVMVKEGEPFSPAVVFFPMHRIERIELDLPDGNLPSLSQRFSAKTGLDPLALLSAPMANGGNRQNAPRAASQAGEEPA